MATRPEHPPRIWALLGHRAGDNNQVLALAEALARRLGGTVEEKRLRYTLLSNIPNRLLDDGVQALAAESRALLAAPWPDIVIGVGQRSVPVARWVKRQSGGRARTVQVGWPRCRPSKLDAVVTTPNYPVPGGDNVLRLSACMGRITPQRLAEGAEACREWQERYPGPWSVLLVGGNSWPWRLDKAALGQAVGDLAARARDRGGAIVATTSRRTPKALRDHLAGLLKDCGAPALLLGPQDCSPLHYPGLLALAADIAVTTDSVAMVSDALESGKPVGLVPAKASALGRLVLAALRPFHPGQDGDGHVPDGGWPRWRSRLAASGLTDWWRDIGLFVELVRARGLVGTPAAPRRSCLPQPAPFAADWVVARLGLEALGHALLDPVPAADTAPTLEPAPALP